MKKICSNLQINKFYRYGLTLVDSHDIEPKPHVSHQDHDVLFHIWSPIHRNEFPIVLSPPKGPIHTEPVE